MLVISFFVNEHIFPMHNNFLLLLLTGNSFPNDTLKSVKFSTLKEIKLLPVNNRKTLVSQKIGCCLTAITKITLITWSE